jgi:hypothetical protein
MSEVRVRSLSLATAFVLSIVLGLAGNLAASTIQVREPWWPWMIWSVGGTLAAAAVVVEIRRHRHESHAAAPGGREGLADVADRLARSVSAQWRQEEERLRLHDPCRLPVRWRQADADVTDHWANIRRAPARGSDDPLTMDGDLGQITDVYRQIPSGRLVVLGAAGAGKTILAIHFLLRLLEQRAGGGPLPVIFRLGSWDPSAASPRRWLTEQLVRDHPGLDVPGPDDMTVAAALVESGLILPVLDGFDEIAPGAQRTGLASINATAMPLVLTSRTDEYRAAVARTAALSGAAVITLDDLTVDDLDSYLPRTVRRSTTGPAGTGPATTKWDPVLARLKDPNDDPAAAALLQVLSTPLMVSLARFVYSDVAADPAELLDSASFATAQDVADHLLDAFVPAAFADSLPGERRRFCPLRRGWDSGRARHWLEFLARQLTEHDTKDLELWRLERAAGRCGTGLLAGCASFLMFGVANLVVNDPAHALALGLLYGIAGSVSYVAGSRIPPSRAELRLRGAAGPSFRLLLVGAAVGFGYGRMDGLSSGLSLVTSSVAGVALAAHAWLRSPSDVSSAPGPAAVLRRDRIAGCVFGLAVGTAFGTAAALTATVMGMPQPVVGGGVALVAGVLLGSLSYGRIGVVVYGSLITAATNVPAFMPDQIRRLDVGLAYATLYAVGIAVVVVLPRAWGTYTVSRIWLALRGQLPWRLTAFLASAHCRGVLRQSGGTYQFRHGRLQDRLATGQAPRQEAGASDAAHPRPAVPAALRDLLSPIFAYMSSYYEKIMNGEYCHVRYGWIRYGAR